MLKNSWLLSIFGISFSAWERPPASSVNETYTAPTECLALRDVYLAFIWVSNETSSHAQTIPSLWI